MRSIYFDRLAPAVAPRADTTNVNESIDFVHTGPKTIAGRYLRRFWQPVYESEKLLPGQAVLIRIMNKEFTLYRSDSGTAYVIDARCPHRGTQLSTGWVEGNDIRCLYHGWKFNPAGKCIEQPAEPKPFCDKIAIGAYPTAEQLGLIFTYFGEAPEPPLPRWPEFERCSVTSIALTPCNFFQNAENVVDDVHLNFVHVGEPARFARQCMPRVSAEETSYGIKITYTGPDRTYHSHFMMPNSHVNSYFLDNVMPGAKKDLFPMRTLFWYVPIDDTSHKHVMVTSGHPAVIQLMREDYQKTHDVAADISAVLSGDQDWHKHIPGVSPRPNMVRVQDGVAVVGQGTIVNRSTDRLGASDAGVILLRKLWLRELRSLAAGEPITAFVRPAVLP
jgi:5,5'-dehydrodivanillate O-demethylase oxygenase subunit